MYAIFALIIQFIFSFGPLLLIILLVSLARKSKQEQRNKQQRQSGQITRAGQQPAKKHLAKVLCNK
ncbi:MAG TPA: hypothetical protein PK268_04255 [Enterococcus sp.]|nr:hypothetical protein [Enterococcus sp.]HPR81102.1 hypothetical protein [Enterococcus sp.]